MLTVTVRDLTKHVDNIDQSVVMNIYMSTMTVGDLTKHVDNRDQSAVMNILHVNNDSRGSYQACR